MRRAIKAAYLNQPAGDLSALENSYTLKEIQNIGTTQLSKNKSNKNATDYMDIQLVEKPRFFYKLFWCARAGEYNSLSADERPGLSLNPHCGADRSIVVFLILVQCR